MLSSCHDAHSVLFSVGLGLLVVHCTVALQDQHVKLVMIPSFDNPRMCGGFCTSVLFIFLYTERIDKSYIKALTATSNCQLSTSEDAWAFFGRKADMPLAYWVKVHKCASFLVVL